MDASFSAVIITIIAALAFDFLNGFHDAANSIATIVSTRVLKPQWAVLWAASFNFLAFAFFSRHVATTMGTGLVDPAIINTSIIFAALLGAIAWNLFTWYFGIPSSSSHALIGGLLGASIAKAGVAPLEFIGIAKTLLAIIVSPLLGMCLGAIFMLIAARIFFYTPPQRVNSIFRKLQFFSAALISLGHGGNDAQKTMGIIAVLLYSTHQLGDKFYIPIWVAVACNLVMALGTCFGGWRIVKTMGMKITKLIPISGCCAESASSLTLFAANILGIPVSTTHTVTGSIVGVGSLYGARAVRWGVASNIVWAWIFTIPSAGCVAAVVWYTLQRLTF